MSFNPDPFKQAQEVFFFRKIKKPIHPLLKFNNNQVIQIPYQKHFGLLLDEKLNFGEHLWYIAKKPIYLLTYIYFITDVDTTP